MDAAYALLGSADRRQLLYKLRQTDRSSVAELALLIARHRETESSAPAKSLEEARQHAYISLVHNHLPRLADHDVLEYDLRSGDVVPASGFAELEALLEQFSETEEMAVSPTQVS